MAKQKDPGYVVEPGGEDPPCFGDGDADRAAKTPSWVVPSAAGASRGFRAADDEWLRKSWPVLLDFLCMDGLGGNQRKTGTLLIFAEEGRFKACLNDRDGGYVSFVSGKTVQELLGALEKGLKTGLLDWRVSKSKR